MDSPAEEDIPTYREYVMAGDMPNWGWHRRVAFAKRHLSMQARITELETALEQARQRARG